MQKLCNLGVPSTSTPTTLQGTACFTWNCSKTTAHVSELHICCHLLLKKICLCLARCYLKHAGLMATPVQSSKAFKIFELIWTNLGKMGRLEDTGSVSTSAGPACSLRHSQAGATAWKCCKKCCSFPSPPLLPLASWWWQRLSTQRCQQVRAHTRTDLQLCPLFVLKIKVSNAKWKKEENDFAKLWPFFCGLRSVTASYATNPKHGQG